jgi:hypothetical protein
MGIAGAGAFMLMAWITARGPGVSPDSVAYLETARSLLAGNGFFAGDQPLTAYPPVYPLLLAIAGWFQHGNVLHAARWLGALLFAVNVMLLGISFFVSTKHSLAAMGCGMLVVLASAPVLRLHAMAWSEAPFIAFTLGAYLLLALYLARSRPWLLLAAALCAGIAMATRYIGFTMLPAMAGVLLFFSERPLRRKLGETLLLTVVASLPLAAWLIRNSICTGMATNRNLTLHPMGPDRALLLGCGAALALACGVLLRRKNGLRRESHTVPCTLPALCLAFCLTYLLGLAVSLSLFDADTPLDGRILAPAFLTFLIPGLALAWTDASAWPYRLLRGGICFVVLLLVVLNLLQAGPEFMRFHKNASGYTSRKWAHSATLAAVSALPAGITLYSNGPDAILFLTGRSATMLPRIFSPLTLKPNPEYPAQWSTMAREVQEGRAVVVYLARLRRTCLPAQRELESTWAIPVLARLTDGALYGRLTPTHNTGADTQ